MPADPKPKSDRRSRRGLGVDAVSIRPVCARDLDAIGAVQEASIFAQDRNVYSDTQLDAWARLGWQYRHQLLDDAGNFFVAEWLERVIGVGGWSPDSLDARLAWLRYFFVHPGAAGQGIGRRLVEAAEGAARRRGRTSFQVWSSPGAVNFYRRAGYRRMRGGRMPVTSAIELDYVLLGKLV
ncbi:MAG: GNAT family N-acetyltransferase [Pseudomonadota bacterium]